MEPTMDLMTAIAKRQSIRAYEDRVLDADVFAELAAYVDELNGESACDGEGALRFQLYGPRREGSDAITMLPPLFAGKVYAYAALVGADTPLGGERVGYYGEKLVLRATQLGLGSCWVASTYFEPTTRREVGEGERLWDVVPLGYARTETPTRQAKMRAKLRAKDKPLSERIATSVPLADVPDWVLMGVEAARLAPSAVNAQPVYFTWDPDATDGNAVGADLADSKRDVFYNDLGIAKLHFEIAATLAGAPGRWEWGLGGHYVRDEI